MKAKAIEGYDADSMAPITSSEELEEAAKTPEQREKEKAQREAAANKQRLDADKDKERLLALRQEAEGTHTRTACTQSLSLSRLRGRRVRRKKRRGAWRAACLHQHNLHSRKLVAQSRILLRERGGRRRRDEHPLVQSPRKYSDRLCDKRGVCFEMHAQREVQGARCAQGRREKLDE